ncbi:MAG: diguanylate cyclase [Actinobacteria bacterium]|nr:diguanylate cyclase [Actinomycetota bacterium]
MNFAFTPQIMPFVVAAFVLTLLVPVAWANRRDPAARWFAATLVSLLVWAVGYCLEILAVSLQDKVFFANVQFFGVATVSVCWWEMVRRYLDLRRIPRLGTAILWLMAAATITLAFVNPGQIFRGTPFIVSNAAPFPVLHPSYGPWYTWVLLPEIALINAAVLTLLGRAAFKAKRFYRRQFVLLMVALALPLAGATIYVFNLSIWADYNFAVALSGLSGFLMGMGLFRWRLFSIIPLAHDRVIENLADGVIVVDRDDRIIDINHSAERITGLSRDAVFGQAAASVLSAYPLLVDVIGAPEQDYLATSLRRDMVTERDGIPRYFALSSSKVTGRRREPLGLIVMMHDITERVRLFEQARELANKDDLTGLPNRRHFFELTAKEFERARRYREPVSLLLLDIDHFKQINDEFGHRAGDRLLHDLAQAWRRELRSSDVIGRVGGEEFAVLLPETDLEVAVEAANRLRRATELMKLELGQTTKVGPMAVTISAGAAQLQVSRAGELEALDSVYERVDRALYEAKRMGRNAVVASDPVPGLRAVI